MQKKYVSVIVMVFVVVFLVGCATTKSRIALYEKAKEKYSIYAVGDTGNFSTDITIFVNDQAVAKGSTTSIKRAVNLSGNYKDAKVDAECKSVATGSMLSRECIVYIDSVKAAELAF
jgi:predicted acyltransferase (DUF342 family)